MSTKDDGGPAFPTKIKSAAFRGIRIRDYFAAHALAGICANPEGGHLTPIAAARDAYEYADEMLVVRAGDGADE